MTNIIRHDRGLDHSRIEKIVSMITDKINDIKYDRSDILSERRKEIKREAATKMGLDTHYKAIDELKTEINELENQIKLIKNKQEPHKIAIAKQMRGYEETYNYNDIKDGSPIDDYIKERIPDMHSIRASLSKIEDEVVEKLWLAKDIDEARALYAYAMESIKTVGNVLPEK